MRAKPVLVSVLALFLLAAGFYGIFGSPVRLYRNRQLKTALADPPPVDTATLNTLIPFAWDEAYTFGPYTSQKEMQAALGVTDRHLPESVDESQHPLIVMRDGEVVASVCGYARNMGFSLWISASPVRRQDCTVFTIRRRPEYVVYTQQIP